MDILIIGNGFDLAHGLPTRYTDFLDFCRDHRNSHKDNLYEFDKCINPNFWIDYFMKYNAGENWADFENEISKVIMSLDSDMQNDGKKFELDDCIKKLSNNFLNGKYIDGGKEQQTFRSLRKYLLDDLNSLIRALEIYLIDIMQTSCVSKNIEEIEKINPDCVLTFNYTDTYARIYGKNKRIKYNYVYGSIMGDNRRNVNDMVLGINEYFSDNSTNDYTEFIAFEKYYQRILKESCSEYKEWIERIKRSGQETELVQRRRHPMQIPYSKYKYIHNLYIFGCSFDITDKDIFRDFILNDNVYTTIFYSNRRDLKSKIANLVIIIGQDELIRRTGGSTKTIEFKLQQDMVERV